VKIDVVGNGEWEKLFVVVIGRTGVVYNNVLEPTQKQIDNKKMSFEFVANAWMAPSAHVIVYYIHPLGENVYDRIKINFDSVFPNKVSDTIHSAFVF
jgi:hypothetical protein